MKVKVTLFMAISVNGKIARSDYSEDFLSNKNWDQLVKLAKNAGCFIWGRKTYELVKDWDDKYFQPLENIFKLVLTSKKNFQTERGFIPVNSTQEAIELLEKKGFKNVILTGGSLNNSSFAKSELIDEIILDVEPIVVGEGIPLFYPQLFDMKLKLTMVKKIGGDIIQLQYRVIK